MQRGYTVYWRKCPVAPASPTEVSPISPAPSGGRLAQPALAARRRRLALRGLGDGQAAPLGLRGGTSLCHVPEDTMTDFYIHSKYTPNAMISAGARLRDCQ